jgi:hypothetical protein
VYTFRADDGFTSDANQCPTAPGESSTVHCDIAFYASPAERAVDIEIRASDAGPVIASRTVTLMPFNRCGAGMAQVLVTSDDGGVPSISGLTYVDACGSL